MIVVRGAPMHHGRQVRVTDDDGPGRLAPDPLISSPSGGPLAHPWVAFLHPVQEPGPSFMQRGYGHLGTTSAVESLHPAQGIGHGGHRGGVGVHFVHPVQRIAGQDVAREPASADSVAE
jgi:hypothetical protein